MRTKNNYQLVYTNSKGKKVVLEISETGNTFENITNNLLKKITVEILPEITEIDKMKMLYKAGYIYDPIKGEVIAPNKKVVLDKKNNYLCIQKNIEGVLVQVYQHRFAYWFMNKERPLVYLPKLKFIDCNLNNLKYENIIQQRNL